MVGSTSHATQSTAIDTSTQDGCIDSTVRSSAKTPVDAPTQVSGLSIERAISQIRGLSSEAGAIFIANWKASTIKQYNTHLPKWEIFCVERSLDPLEISEINLLNFLAWRKSTGLGKSSLTTAKAAVVNLWIIVEGVKFESPRLSLFMKGVSQLQPVRKKVGGIWDPTTVLDLFRRWPDNSELSLMDLSRKCVMLIALTTAQRTQTLQVLSIADMTVTKHAVAFTISSRLKQTLGDRHTPLLYLPKFGEKKLCVWRCVLAYFMRTNHLRNTKKLFITTTSPFGPVTTTTVSRWLRTVLAEAGVNTSVYKAHSTRSAASSKARLFLSIEKVMEAADWKSEQVFAKHYCREVSARGEFAAAVMSSL